MIEIIVSGCMRRLLGYRFIKGDEVQIIQDKRLLYFLGSYLGFYLFIVSVALDLSGFGLVFKLLTVGMFCIYIYIFIGNNEHTIDFQKTILLLFGVLLSTFMMVRGKMQDQYVIVNNVCVFVLLFVTVIYFIQNHKGLFLKNWIYKNSIILLIIFSFGLMSLEVIDSWLMWDAAIYYSHPYSNTDLQGIVSSFDANFAGIDGLYLAGHVSLGYSLWLILFQLFKEGSESVQIANIILAGISIFAYYQILRKIFSNRFSDKIISLATMPYAFSPFILGLVGNLNLDSATMYFFIIFIACSLYQFEILEWVLAFLLCFTKENAILYFAIYILMKVICEYRRDNLFQWTTFIKYSLRSLRNYIYALPLILWCLLKMLKPVWGGAILWSNDGMNCFGIDVGVITMKLKQIFLLNFNWIFWIIILGGVLYLP